MKKFGRKVLKFTIKEPERTSLRDLSKTLATINNLYNYYVLLTIQEIQRKVESTVTKSGSKKPNVFLYSSSLERIMGNENRMAVLSVSKRSPLNVSLEGVGEAIDALRRLLEMFTPIYWTVKKLEKKEKALTIRKLEIELDREEVALGREQRESFEEHLELIERVDSLKLSDELKSQVMRALRSNMRSIELNPVKPMLSLKGEAA